MKRFRQLTQNHIVIMGRKTLESIGRPLPNRVNIVLSKEQKRDSHGVEWVSSAEDALFLADFYSICEARDTFFVIGGAEIYKMFYSKDLYNRVYLTEVFCEVPNGDAFFPFEFDNRKWAVVEQRDFLASEIDQFRFRFVTLDKRSKTIRTRFKSEFLTNFDETNTWRQRALTALSNWEKTHAPPRSEVQPDLDLKFGAAV
jgi:dihydrofolate reductase